MGVKKEEKRWLLTTCHNQSHWWSFKSRNDSLSLSLEQPNSLISCSSSLDLHSSKNIYTHWSRLKHIGTTFSSSASLFVSTKCGFSCFGRKTRLNRLNGNHSATKMLSIVKSQQILHNNFLFCFVFLNDIVNFNYYLFFIYWLKHSVILLLLTTENVKYS